MAVRIPQVVACTDGNWDETLGKWVAEQAELKQQVDEYAKELFLAALKAISQMAHVSYNITSTGDVVITLAVDTKRARLTLLEWLALHPAKYPVVVTVAGKTILGPLLG